MQAHPRFQIHFTPTYSSWLNQVERFFAFVTEDLLQRSHHNTVQQLEADIRAWIKDWNTHPQPFIWTKSADEILESLGRRLELGGSNPESGADLKVGRRKFTAAEDWGDQSSSNRLQLGWNLISSAR